jgi:alginate O-acetyltransferase complex protein AlgJ
MQRLTPILPSLTREMVHKGQDGWLFLTGGSNFVVDLYQRDAGALPDRGLAHWRDALEARKKRCDMLGIAYAHLLIPEKMTIYGHKLASPIVDPDLAPAIRLYQSLAKNPAAAAYVDLVEPMRSCRDERDLYWRTDTHWTPAGCRLAYEALCARLGLPSPPDLDDRGIRQEGRLMDLGAKLDPPVWEIISEVHWLKGASRVYENAIARLLEDPSYGGMIHVGSRATFRNPQALTKGRLMLFGDSFSGINAHALTALLAETIEHVDFVWASSVDWRLVGREKPDFLVTQMAERYMAVPPLENFSLRTTEIRQNITVRRRRFNAWLRAKRAGLQRSSNIP